MLASRRAAARLSLRCPNQTRPGSIRSPTPQPSPSPSICPSTRRNFSIDSLITSTADSIASIHNAGVPWYVTIPLVALGVNLTLRLPLQYYNRRLDRKRADLQPLVQAWMSRHSMRQALQGKPDSEERALEVLTQTERSTKRLYKAWGVQNWKSFLPMVTMAPFAIVSLALRQLSGAYQSSSPQLSPELLTTSLQESASGVLEVAQGTSPSLMDPSLTTGGILWFVDLTATDPYLLLPIACSFLIWLNSMGRMSAQERRNLFSVEYMKRLKTRAQRARVGLARGTMIMPLFPLVFYGMPAGIFLYWLCTFGLNTVNDFVLRKVLPKKDSPLNRRLQLPTIRPFLVGKRGIPKTAEETVNETMKKL
ncbi:hypothetical protein K4F52_000193 [Lecanicillium sp. MT-2017a]|nr:hypothetical protein K4F52_000193 [Lecanicillium sp. MT-2017a]